MVGRLLWNPGEAALSYGRTPCRSLQLEMLSARQSSAMGTNILDAFVAGSTEKF